MAGMVEFTFCLAAIQPPLATENKHNCSLECAYTADDQMRFRHVLCSGRRDNQRAVTCRNSTECSERYKGSVCLPVNCICKSHLSYVKTPEEHFKLRRKTSITICAVNLSPKIDEHFYHNVFNRSDTKRSLWHKAWYSPMKPFIFMFVGLTFVMLVSFCTYYVRTRGVSVNLCCGVKIGRTERSDPEFNNGDTSVNSRMLNSSNHGENAIPNPEEVELALILNDQPPSYEVALQVSTTPKYLERQMPNVEQFRPST